MTITVKRMFAAALAVGVLGVVAAFGQRSDVNTVDYFESFQSGWGGTNSLVNVTNGWYSSSADDLSMVTNLVGSYAFSACTYSISNYDHSANNRVLKLATEGATLSNSFGSGHGLLNVKTWVDTMVQFVASEDKPAALVTGTGTLDDTGIKAAVYANVESNLVIYCGVVDSGNYGIISNTLAVTSYKLDATNWYRLTIVFDDTVVPGDSAGDLPLFKVLINNNVITNSNGYADDWRDNVNLDYGTLPPTSPTAGVWFPFATRKGLNSVEYGMLRAIAFQGTGYIDDLVVTTTEPTYTGGGAGTTYFMLTVVNGGNGTSDLGGVNSNPLTQVQIAQGSGTTIVFNASQWYRINSFTSNGVSVAAALTQTNFSWTLTNVQAPVSNAVSFVKPEWTIYQYVTNGNGTPSDGSTVTVTNGDSYAQTFTGASQWFELTSLLEDGSEIGNLGANSQGVSLSQVQNNHSFVANFVRPQYSVSAVVNGGHGSSSVSGTPVNKGDPVTITYTGDSWYRVNTLTTNSQTVAGAAGNRYVTVEVANVVCPIAATGTFTLATSNPWTGEGVDTGWLAGWGHDESATTNSANTINGLPASVYQQYLLNIDPYITESATFKVHALSVTQGTNVAVTVRLQVNSANHTNILGSLSLDYKNVLSNASWTAFSVTPVTGDVFTNGVHVFNFTDTVSNRFYRAVVQ
jgi:hypothetical protein